MAMKNRLSACLVAVLVCAGLIGCGSDSAKGSSFDAEFEKAAKVIAERDEWPASPEKAAEAFWQARYAKNYREMEILWPGSASIGWPEICAKDPQVKYVFGRARRLLRDDLPHGATEISRVPYATQEYFTEHGQYNLEMVLHDLNTMTEGTRWYVVSGN
jgi:hypothetical protein